MVVTPYNSVKAGQYLSPVVSTETKQSINLSYTTRDSTRKSQRFNQRYGVDLCANMQLCTAIFPVVVGCCSCSPLSTELSFKFTACGSIKASLQMSLKGYGV
jgi:hypothetical protein